ncbi:Calcium-transporting ATPase lmo0841 [uncultured Eubacterium sp.]|nr:Calcium-transporting ATPase lmo0841 [uncultured Eubacterium sp.]
MYYNKQIQEILEEFQTTKNGLDESAVTKSREQYGENRLYEKKKKSVFTIFLEQFKDLLVIILIIAAIISMSTGNVESTAVIIAVLILNAILGTVQYVKAEKSLESLKSLSSPVAKVIRNGQPQEIDAAELVCGDIVRLEAGDVVPGDGRIIESYSLKVNESSLTGESEGVDKRTEVIDGDAVALGDQTNMVFSGSLVTYGRGLAVITGVGIHTELGKIADLMNNTAERKTPLQITMDNFSKKLSIGIMLICAVVFALNVYRGMAIADSLLFAVALAVAAIPEALSSIITISLAIGTSRMADQNAIIKQLNAVEGLGCVSIICSDKTGTLTQNKMTVEQVLADGEKENALLQASILCNDTAIVDGATAGDPTETALVDYYMTKHDDYEQVKAALPRLSELPFDSDRKLMSTLHNIEGQYIMYTKGALDVILERTASLSEEEKDKIRQSNFDLSNQGLRVLAFARKIMASDGELKFGDESNFEFLGLVAEMDPPRAESAQAVADCMEAGIKPIMITGDHKITASAIAKRIGILQEGDIAVTGTELDAMSDDELNEKLAHISVYARVSPDNKIRIVQAWQDQACIVAMTGDGVNDAPALKSADVGVAMGITGTEVAKDSASMILTDDNFATIIKSVLNGRNIYANIKNAIKFLLSGNTAGILVVLFASIMALPSPFTAVQLLFINLITDSLPALAISMEPSNPALIHDKPRPRNESVLTRETLLQIGLQGLAIGAATIAAFYVGLQTSAVTASTMAFATLCLARLWHGFNSRGKQSIFRLGITTNIYTIGAFVVGAILLFAILLVPFFAKAFLIASLTGAQIGWICGLAFAPTLLIQIVKIINDQKSKN